MVPRWPLDHVRDVDERWRAFIQSLISGRPAGVADTRERDVLVARLLARRQSRRRRAESGADGARTGGVPGRVRAGVDDRSGRRRADADRADTGPRLAALRS